MLRAQIDPEASGRAFLPLVPKNESRTSVFGLREISLAGKILGVLPVRAIGISVRMYISPVVSFTTSSQTTPWYEDSPQDGRVSKGLPSRSLASIT